MSLVPAKCTQCGASIEVDNEKEAAICAHCGTAFIVEKAINNYNITNNITNHIHADVVNVVDGNIEDYIRNAHSAYKFEDYKSLEENTEKILKLNPENIDGHFYKVVCILKKLSENSNKGADVNLLSALFNYALNVFENNYNIEDLKTKLASVFYVVCNSSDTNYVRDNVYPKLKTIVEKYGYDPILYINKINNGYILKNQRMSQLLEMYFEYKYPGVLHGKNRVLEVDDWIFTKDFVIIGCLKDTIYYKEEFTYNIFMNSKRFVSLRVQNKKQDSFRYFSIGRFDLFASTNKYVKEKYDRLIEAGYKIDIEGENNKILTKLKKALNAE